MTDLTPLKNKITELEIVPPLDFYDMVEIYLARLIEKNKTMSLTAVAESEMVARHFADSVEVAARLDFAGKTAIDIGSGAGFPGLPLRLLFSDLRLTLLDSTAKKLVFVGEVVSELGLGGVTLLPMRAEEAAHDPRFREVFDIALARGVAAMPALCELCLPFVGVEGTFVAYKMAAAREDIESGRRAAGLLGGNYEWEREYMVSNAANILVGVKKISQTSGKYPRKYAQIKQNPL